MKAIHRRYDMVWIRAIQALIEPLVESWPNVNMTWTSFHTEAGDVKGGDHSKMAVCHDGTKKSELVCLKGDQRHHSS